MVCARMKNIPANGDRDLIQVEAKLQSYLSLTHIALMTFANLYIRLYKLKIIYDKMVKYY